jgi:hypothetical protein
MQRLLIGLGLALVLAGIAWPLLSRIGLGRLPGDIMIRRGSTSFYFPRDLHCHQHRAQRPDVAA